jgi:hypothetical protein
MMGKRKLSMETTDNKPVKEVAEGNFTRMTNIHE